MEDDEEIQSHPSPDSGSPVSPTSPPPNGRITVTVAAAPPQNALTLALPIQQQTRTTGNGGGGGGREDCWSEGATAVLIGAWGERYVELSRGNLKQKHWKEVADIVSSREDYTKTPKTDIQCKNRIDTVKKKYKSEKSKIAAGGGPSKWPFYNRLDELIGPTAKPAPNSGAGASGVHKVPIGIPVGIRSFPQFQQQQQQTQRQKQKQKQKQKHPIESESESEPEPPSPISADSLPPETYRPNLKRPRTQREFNNPNPNLNFVRPVVSQGNTRDGGGGGERREKNWGNSVRELTKAIVKFGEAYEQTESSKLQQLVEMEKQRMKFAKELELQRMQFFMKTQLELSQLKKQRRRVGNNSNHHHHHHHNNNNNNNNNIINNNSDSSS